MRYYNGQLRNDDISIIFDDLGRSICILHQHADAKELHMFIMNIHTLNAKAVNSWERNPEYATQCLMLLRTNVRVLIDTLPSVMYKEKPGLISCILRVKRCISDALCEINNQ